MKTESIYRTQEGDTVDMICHHYYGATKGYVEHVLDANPKLADYGAVLPAGIVINLPALPEKTTYQDTIKLWD